MSRLSGRALWKSAASIAIAGFLLPGVAAGASGDEESTSTRIREWSAETLELAARLPVQDEGRVKPLSTMAAFSLLRIHHKRSCKDDKGNELTPLEWLLDVLYYPEAAAAYPLFRIESYEALQSIGVSTDGKSKRDLYSYEEIQPGRERLMRQSHTFAEIDAKERTPAQNQIVNLGQNVLEFERLSHFLDFARADIDVEGIPPFADAQGDLRARGFSEIVGAAPELVAAIRAAKRSEDARTDQAMSQLFSELSVLADSSSMLRLLPPSTTKDENGQWFSPGEIASNALLHDSLDARHVSMLAALEGMVDVRGRPEQFREQLASFNTTSRSLASARGEQNKVDLEVSFYALDPFYRALLLYLLAFVLTAITWLRPGMRRVYGAALILTGAGLALNVTGIVLRCILRSRPPVSTLYETVLFITAVAVLAALVMERIDRKRIAGSLAAILGTLGLFLAMKFEEIQGTDTMPQLVAVLDTNFWLATHVTCITMGYSAGLLASAFAHIYILGRVLGIRRADDAGYRSLGRTVYGTICFALIFSVVGTILGGVWANDSWGRFWGWDPKENGALMIVLYQLAILHGRMGGYIRAFGISVSAILGGVIVAFSWWGVNLLGIGLHSYGFTDGIWRGLLIFYSIEAAVLLAGGIWWANQRWRVSSQRPA